MPTYTTYEQRLGVSVGKLVPCVWSFIYDSTTPGTQCKAVSATGYSDGRCTVRATECSKQ